MFQIDNFQQVKFYLALESRRLAMSACGKKEAFSLVPMYEARRFMEDCLIAVGTCKQFAGEMADVLIAADSRGHYSHGMNRLGEFSELRLTEDLFLHILVTSQPSLVLSVDVPILSSVAYSTDQLEISTHSVRCT